MNFTIYWGFFVKLKVPQAGKFDKKLYRKLRSSLIKAVIGPLHITNLKIPGPSVSEVVNNQKYYNRHLDKPEFFQCQCDKFAELGISHLRQTDTAV